MSNLITVSYEGSYIVITFNVDFIKWIERYIRIDPYASLWH